MIVADASAVVEVLLALPSAGEVRAAVAEHSELHVPEYFNIEALSALRRYAIRDELTQLRATERSLRVAIANAYVPSDRARSLLRYGICATR